MWLTECNLCVFPWLSYPDNSASHLDVRIFLLTGFSSLQLNPGECWIPCVSVCSLGSTSPFPKFQLSPRLKHHQDNSKLDDSLWRTWILSTWLMLPVALQMNSMVWPRHSRLSLELVTQQGTQYGNTLTGRETVKVKVIQELHALRRPKNSNAMWGLISWELA